MGRVTVPLLPALSDCCDTLPLLGMTRRKEANTFCVQRRGKYLGLAYDAGEAWALLKKDLVQELQDEAHQARAAPLPLSPMAKRTVMQHVRAMQEVFQNFTQGDLSAAALAQREHRSMFAHEPALMLASIQGLEERSVCSVGGGSSCSSSRLAFWSPGVHGGTQHPDCGSAGPGCQEA